MHFCKHQRSTRYVYIEVVQSTDTAHPLHSHKSPVIRQCPKQELAFANLGSYVILNFLGQCARSVWVPVAGRTESAKGFFHVSQLNQVTPSSRTSFSFEIRNLCDLDILDLSIFVLIDSDSKQNH